MSTITWSAVLDDATAPCVSRCTTQIIAYTPPEPHEAAATAFKWWLGEVSTEGHDCLNWNVVDEDEQHRVSAIVVIHEPPHMAGTYAVEAERVITARGYRSEPEDVVRAAAILAKCESEDA